MRPPDWVARFLDAADLDAVEQAIEAAEAATSAEISVHIERWVAGSPDAGGADRAGAEGGRAAGAVRDAGDAGDTGNVRDGEVDAEAVLARARAVFEHLGLAQTADRNAVLIYVAVDDHAVAVVGDEGIHARVGDAYWAGVRDLLVERLRGGRPREALVGAVEEVGRALRAHFPRRPEDVDELPNRPSVGR